MRIGVPREIKNNEYRVAITPAGAHELVEHGHRVLVEAGAGAGSAVTDDEYRAAGADVVPAAEDAWGADLVLKVKEPQPSEFGFFRPDLTLFTYLHLAAERRLTKALVDSGCTAIAYETVQLPDRSTPLLAPMSTVAGRLSVQVGAYNLMRTLGGRGILMGGVPGTAPAKVTVIGGGVAGSNAIQMAVGLHAEVTVLDTNVRRLAELDTLYAGRIQTRVSNKFELGRSVEEADLVVGAVLVPGAKAPKLVSNDLVSRMREGSVLVDIAIDQGGCFADSRPTTHDDPTYTVHGSVFYCVANMPGAVPRTSTFALTNVTVPYAVRLADGVDAALAADPALALGLNVRAGEIVSPEVARAHGMRT